MNVWTRSVPVNRKNYFGSSIYDDYEQFQPHHKHKEPDNMWDIMRNEYSRIWKDDRDKQMSAYYFYRHERKVQLMRRFVVKLEAPKIRKELEKPSCNKFVMKRFQGIPARVDTNLHKIKRKKKEKIEEKAKIDEEVVVDDEEDEEQKFEGCKCAIEIEA